MCRVEVLTTSTCNLSLVGGSSTINWNSSSHRGSLFFFTCCNDKRGISIQYHTTDCFKSPVQILLCCELLDQSERVSKICNASRYIFLSHIFGFINYNSILTIPLALLQSTRNKILTKFIFINYLFSKGEIEKRTNEFTS